MQQVCFPNYSFIHFTISFNFSFRKCFLQSFSTNFIMCFVVLVDLLLWMRLTFNDNVSDLRLCLLLYYNSDAIIGILQ